MKKPIVKNLFFGALFLFTASAHAATCKVTDVTVNGSDSNMCAGQIAGNDSIKDMNTIFGEPDSLIKWEQTAKVDAGVTGGSLSAVEATSGAWTYTAPADKPLSSPFIVVLKGSPGYSAYLFKGLEDLLSVNGTFFISLVNNGGNDPELSHISIYSTGSDIPGTSIFGNPVPLPAALWLFGPALLGFMGFRRKNKS